MGTLGAATAALYKMAVPLSVNGGAVTSCSGRGGVGSYAPWARSFC